MRIAFSSDALRLQFTPLRLQFGAQGVHLGALYPLLVANGFDALAEKGKIDCHSTRSRSPESAIHPFQGVRLRTLRERMIV